MAASGSRPGHHHHHVFVIVIISVLTLPPSVWVTCDDRSSVACAPSLLQVRLGVGVPENIRCCLESLTEFDACYKQSKTVLTLVCPALELRPLARPGDQLRPGPRLNLRGNWKQNRIMFTQRGYQYCPLINLTNLFYISVIFVSY